MTAALATTTDVANCLGRSLSSPEETNRANTLLLIVSSAYENEADFKFAPGTYTIGRKVHNGRCKIPATNPTVTAVRSIDTVDGSISPVTNFTQHRSMLYQLEGVRPNHPVRYSYYPMFIEVDFTVPADGTAPIPPIIVNLVANCVARTLSGPPAGVSQESVGPYHMSYVNPSGDVYISKNDRLILSRYKQAKPAINMNAQVPGNDFGMYGGLR